MRQLLIIQPSNPAAQSDCVFTLPIGLFTKVRLIGLLFTSSQAGGSTVQITVRLGDLQNTGQFIIPSSFIATATTITVQHFNTQQAATTAPATGAVVAGGLPELWWNRDLVVRIGMTSATFSITNVLAVYEVSD